MSKLTYRAVFLLGIVLVLGIALLCIDYGSIYAVMNFDDYGGYSSYTTENKAYTVSLRDVSEAGLVGAVRLNTYLVNNGSGQVKHIAVKRLDYHEDFTPYVSYEEYSGGVTVVFHSKFSQDRLEIPCE